MRGGGPSSGLPARTRQNLPPAGFVSEYYKSANTVIFMG